MMREGGDSSEDRDTAVCLFVYLQRMIVFNIITAIVLKRRDRRTVRASARFRQHILQQIERINTGQQVERRHKKYLSRQLTRTGNMIAFDKMLEDLYREEPRQATEYLSQLGGVIVYLTIRYGRKDRIEAAYFPYIIKKVPSDREPALFRRGGCDVYAAEGVQYLLPGECHAGPIYHRRLRLHHEGSEDIGWRRELFPRKAADRRIVGIYRRP